MVAAYLNRIATSVPNNDMHQRFVDWVPRMIKGECGRALFRRLFISVKRFLLHGAHWISSILHP
jgi:hypothetical protein